MTNYQAMPVLSVDDFAALKADIAERGVLVPIEYDEAGNVLDGHHRIRACHELGIPESEWPRVTRRGWTEEQKRQHARQLNLARRHLSQAQKRELIAAQLKETPQQSNRQIAAGLGVDDTTVGDARKRLEATAGIPQLDKTTGADGKARPAKSSSRKAPATPAEAAPRAWPSGELEEAPDDRSIYRDPDFQAEADAAARDIELERDERIALSGADVLLAENESLKKQLAVLDRRINSLNEENSALKQREKMWRERALAAGWKGHTNV